MRSLLLLLLVYWAAPGFGLQEPPPSGQVSREAVTRSLERAFQLISEGQVKKAKTELERATELAGGPCGECLLGMSHIYAAEKKWRQVVETLDRALPLLTSPSLRARAYNQLGVANVMLNTPESLTRAADALRQGADLGGPWGTMARYNLAEALFRRRSWAEAAEAARGYLEEAGPEGTALKEARILLCRARRHLPDEPPAEPDQSSEPKRVEGEVTRPEILFQTKPVYTSDARMAQTKGEVIVEAIIDQEGCVRNAKPLKSLPNGLTESAMETIRQWVFSPAMLAGRPVKVYYVLTINFR